MDKGETNTMLSLEEHFTKIYETNYWNGIHSKSGTGSDIETTKVMRPQFVELINRRGFKSMIDAPCGDFFWMKETIQHLLLDKYTGLDIVKEMVDKNNEVYGDGDKIQFGYVDVVNEILPKVDLIFSRDCLVHFSYETVKIILQNYIDSGSEYLLMTTFMSDQRQYSDILDGQWRAINFLGAPMNLPKPEEIIFEGCIEDKYRWTDKCLALWKLSDLKGHFECGT